MFYFVFCFCFLFLFIVYFCYLFLFIILFYFVCSALIFARLHRHHCRPLASSAWVNVRFVLFLFFVSVFFLFLMFIFVTYFHLLFCSTLYGSALIFARLRRHHCRPLTSASSARVNVRFVLFVSVFCFCFLFIFIVYFVTYFHLLLCFTLYVAYWFSQDSAAIIVALSLPLPRRESM